MREEEAFAFLALVIGITISIKVIASAWLKHWENKLKYSKEATQIDPQLNARMERIEQAIDSIAVEVERISENQRFTTKILSEREAARRLSS